MKISSLMKAIMRVRNCVSPVGVFSVKLATSPCPLDPHTFEVALAQLRMVRAEPDIRGLETLHRADLGTPTISRFENLNPPYMPMQGRERKQPAKNAIAERRSQISSDLHVDAPRSVT